MQEPASILVAVDGSPSADKAVDAAYGYKGRADDAERVAFLFEGYQALSG